MAGKQEILSFKLDSSLAKTLRGMENRSEFIRNAILAALGSLCPVCNGTGILALGQRRHWDHFVTTHPLEECDTCQMVHPVCRCDGHHQDSLPCGEA